MGWIFLSIAFIAVVIDMIVERYFDYKEKVMELERSENKQ